MERTVLKVEGMTCGHCVGTVTRVLSSVPGVKRAEVDLGKAEAVVEHEGSFDRAAAARSLEEEGYRLVP